VIRFFDLDSHERRSVDSGLNWIAGTWGAFVVIWLVATFHDHAYFWSVVSLITACVVMLALVWASASFRRLNEADEQACGYWDACRPGHVCLRCRSRGVGATAPTVSLSQELSDEMLLDQLVTECEQRLNLIPADPLFASRLDASVSARAGQGSAT